MLSMVAAPLMVGSMASVASAADGFNIFSDAKFSGEIRPRYENADKKGGADSASAYTARTRLAVEAGLLEVDGLKAKVGVTSVNNFGYTDYAPENGAYDLILDPQQAIVSEAYISYTAADTTLLAGRSFVNLDDQRFIGTVGWRQMERSYDTATVVNKSIEGLTLLGSWVYGYQGVNSNPTTDTGSVFLNVNYKASDALVLSGFGYLLADVHDTYGVRVSGKAAMDSVKLSYAASYAMQSKASLDYNSAANAEIDATYYDAALAANISGIIVGAEYEVLGQANGSSAKGFTTPLATLHKFQGFADEFLVQTAGSNNNGLMDASLKAGYVSKGFGKLLGFYHSFSAETGSATDLGSEFDALYANGIPGVNGLKGLVKAAFYQAGETGSGHTADNTKFWVQLDYKF